MIDGFHGMLIPSSGQPYFFELHSNFKNSKHVERISARWNIANLAVSEDGKMIAATDSTPASMPSRIRLWDALEFVRSQLDAGIPPSKAVIEADVHDIKALRFAPDGKSLLAISEEKVQQIIIGQEAEAK